MCRYLVRRLLIALPSLFGISIMLFTMLALAPGDPFCGPGDRPADPAVGAAGAARQIRPR